MKALDLRQHHCQTLLTICRRFIKKNVKNSEKEKKIISECRLIGIEDNKLSYKCEECNDKLHKPINGLDKKFPNTDQLCSKNVKKFALLLKKTVYPYEYMDSWENFNKAAILSKEGFYIKLSLEGITDEDYNHAEKVP